MTIIPGMGVVSAAGKASKAVRLATGAIQLLDAGGNTVAIVENGHDILANGADVENVSKLIFSAAALKGTDVNRLNKAGMSEKKMVKAASEVSKNAPKIEILQKARDVLSYTQAKGTPPTGYVGGKVFKNREGRLPANGKYREYDVNPKKQGDRNAERIVVDEETGRAWYTNDHYSTFSEIL